MSQIFISYARTTESQARLVAESLRALGYGVWRDDELPPHRAYSEVIEERIRAARAVVVVWSSDAIKSQWVRAEADLARQAGTLIQLSIDGALPPLPFNQIHCVDLAGWSGEGDAPDWRKVAESVAELLEQAPIAASPTPIPPPLPDKPSLAVLPFVNLSNDPDQEYFVEGMMDEVITALTRIHSLFVIASGSTRSLKGQAVDAQEAARRLGVRYILEGSVRRSGSRVRISVKLVDAVGGAQIWAERFEDTLEDVFALQDQVALSVAGVIEPNIQAAEARRVARRPIESLGCYDLYLRAAPLRATLRQAEVTQALDLLERALALEPDFAPALAQAAGCHSQICLNGWSQDGEAHRRKGLEMAERAVAAASDDAAVLAQAANAIMDLDQDIDRAAALLDRATRLNPGSANAWFLNALPRLITGDAEAAIEQLERAARLDPISHLAEVARAHIAAAWVIRGDFQEALRLFRGATYRSPRLRLTLAAMYGHLGMFREALDELALCESQSQAPVETMVAFMTRRPEHRALLLDGIALARQGAANHAR